MRSRNREATKSIFGIALLGLASFIGAPIRAQVSDQIPLRTEELNTYIEDALGVMESFSIRRDSIDWDDFRQQTFIAAADIESIEQAHVLVRDTLRRLGDGHSLFYPPGATRALNTAGAVSQALPWWSPESLVLDERISYVMVPSYTGTDPERMSRFADEVQNAIRAVDLTTTCGWIVDLRSNGGGTVHPMLVGIGPLVGEGEFPAGINAAGNIFVRWYRDGRVGVGDLENARVSGEPYVLRSPETPIAVLIGPGTGSSGEATALSIIGRPDTRVFGRPSAGLTTSNSRFELADGATIFLSTGAMMDRAGNTYDGPIEPDVYVEDSNAEVPITEQSVVTRASEWLSDHVACQQ